MRRAHILHICSLMLTSALRAAPSIAFVLSSGSRSSSRIPSLRRISSLRTTTTTAAASTQLAMQQHKIFCYGDSLTAGTSPPLAELYPYGPHLERSLKELMPDATPSPMVRWSGYPGWTATAMADSSTLNGPSGLRSFLRSIKEKTGSPASLCIILAGTNDLAYANDANPIVDAIKTLHMTSHDEGVPTVAVGIPPSAWQKANADAANMASSISESLKQWCESSSGSMATFVPCPIEPSTVGGELWSPDGLHLSPAGFQALGEGLAPLVVKVIATLDAKE